MYHNFLGCMIRILFIKAANPIFLTYRHSKYFCCIYCNTPTDVRYSIFNKFFCIQLKIYINFYFLYFKSSIRSFSSFLRKDHKGSNLLDSYENKYKLAPADLAFKNRNLKDFRVFYNEQLENDYVKKLVTSKSDLDGDGIRIIGENESVVLKDEDDCIVGAVIRQATSQNVTKHFGAKIKVTIESHYPLKRGPEHASAAGIMAGHGPRANITPIPTDSYSYNKHLDPHTQRIFDTDEIPWPNGYLNMVNIIYLILQYHTKNLDI